MENNRPLVYHMNQKLLAMQFVLILIALVLGVWLTFFFRPHNYIAMYSLMGLGIFLLLLVGLGSFNLIRRMTAPKELLIITDEGILDRTTDTGVGVIKWEDIKGIREEFVAMNKFVRIDVANPDFYIAQARNAVKSRLMKNYNKMNGSPIMITARMVGVKHEILFEALRFEFNLEKEKWAAKAAADQAASTPDSPPSTSSEEQL